MTVGELIDVLGKVEPCGKVVTNVAGYLDLITGIYEMSDGRIVLERDNIEFSKTKLGKKEALRK